MPWLILSIGAMSFLNRREERLASASLLSGPTTTKWDPAVGVWLKTPPTKQCDAPFVVEKFSAIVTVEPKIVSRYWMPPPLNPEPIVKAATANLSLMLMPLDGKLLPMRMVLDSPAVPRVPAPIQILLDS